MDTFDTRVSTNREPSFAADLARGTLLLLWTTVRLPALALLAILEPIVRFVLCAVATLGVLMAFFWEFSGAAPNFPFWGMLGFSVGCSLLLLPYHGLMRLLSK